MPTVITVCDTCRRENISGDKSGQPEGEKLAEAVEAAASGNDNVSVRRFSCLMGCSFSCNIAIEGKDKISYILGEFTPEKETAEAIVDYAELHAKSETGQVPYKQWPQPIKGHFRARLPLHEPKG